MYLIVICTPEQSNNNLTFLNEPVYARTASTSAAAAAVTADAAIAGLSIETCGKVPSHPCRSFRCLSSISPSPSTMTGSGTITGTIISPATATSTSSVDINLRLPHVHPGTFSPSPPFMVQTAGMMSTSTAVAKVGLVDAGGHPNLAVPTRGLIGGPQQPPLMDKARALLETVRDRLLDHPGMFSTFIALMQKVKPGTQSAVIVTVRPRAVLSFFRSFFFKKILLV